MHWRMVHSLKERASRRTMSRDESHLCTFHESLSWGGKNQCRNDKTRGILKLHAESTPT